MTAFERELMQRLNHAGVNVKKPIAAGQLRQVERMLRTVEGNPGRQPHLSMSQDFRFPTAESFSRAFGCTARVCAVQRCWKERREKDMFLVAHVGVRHSPAASKASMDATYNQTSQSLDDISFAVRAVSTCIFHRLNCREKRAERLRGQERERK